MIAIAKRTLSLTLLSLLVGLTVQAEIYNWTDANGKKHYTNITPPPDQGFKTLQEKQAGKIPPFTAYRVLKVYDGDSFKAAGHDITLQVRLIGIDAPETRKKNQPAQPYGEKAKKRLKRLIEGQTVRLKGYGTDMYNRLLADAYKDDTYINRLLVREGLAEVYLIKPVPGLDTLSLKSAQKEAREERRGIWRLGSDHVRPYDWRRKYRK